ncbi:MAG: hypothetical protein U5R48_18845 [Gammaproteobacteria bacterium]|nr:hypothetical protein [Gammaproteobacteria bacterium]
MTGLRRVMVVSSSSHDDFIENLPGRVRRPGRPRVTPRCTASCWGTARRCCLFTANDPAPLQTPASGGIIELRQRLTRQT